MNEIKNDYGEVVGYANIVRESKGIYKIVTLMINKDEDLTDKVLKIKIYSEEKK